MAGTDAVLSYSAGLRPEIAHRVAGYFATAYYLPIGWAYEHSRSRVLLGPTGLATKRRRGGRLSPLWRPPGRFVPNDVPVLVEEFVDGPEYSWEALVAHGEVIFSSLTRKETTGPPQFVETLHEVAHGRRDPELLAGADALGDRVAEALGVREALMCVEFRRTAQGLVPMEAMVRMAGDHIVECTSLACDVDLLEAHLRVAAGASPAEVRARMPALDAAGGKRQQEVASVFCVAEADGVLAELDLAALDDCAGVLRHGVRMRAGMPVRAARSSADRLGFAIVTGADIDDLRASVAEARQKVVVRVEPMAAGES